MAKTELNVINDLLTNESATLEKVNVCVGFGVNCGATVRATIRLMSRLQHYLVASYNVPLVEIGTTAKAFKRLFVEIGIVSAEEAEFYFDSRKESIIEAETAKQSAKADTLKHKPTAQEQKLLTRINEFLAKALETLDEKEAHKKCVVLLQTALKCDLTTAKQFINTAQAQLLENDDNPFL